MSNSKFILKLLILNLNPPQQTSSGPGGFLNEFFLKVGGIMAHILERLFQRLDKMKHFPTLLTRNWPKYLESSSH